MAGKTDNKIVPKEDDQKINWLKSLTSDGLSKEAAMAKAKAALGPSFEAAKPNKTETELP